MENNEIKDTPKEKKEEYYDAGLVPAYAEFKTTKQTKPKK